MNETMTPEQTQRALRAVVIGGFLAAFGVALVSFTLPLVSLDARISGSWLGTGFAGFFLARLIAGPLGGLWADYASARTPLLCGVTVGAIVPMIYLMAPSLSALYVIQFVLGIVSGLVRPVALAILGGNAPEGSESKWFTAHVLAFNAALFIGPLLGGLLYWDRRMEPVLIGLALCMVLSHTIIFSGVPADIKSRRPLRETEDDSVERPYMAALMAAIFGRTFGIGVFVAFYPVLLALKLGMYGLTVGILYSLPGLMTCLGLPLGPWLREHGKCDPVVSGMLLSAAGLILAGMSVTMWHFAIAGVLMGTGSALSIAESMRLASAVSRDQGRIFGITHLVTGLGFVIGPLFGGVVLQMLGQVGVAFILAGLIGWFCLLFWDRYTGWNRDPHRHPGKWLLARFVPAVVLIAAMVMAVSFHIDKARSEHDDLYHYTDMAMGTVVNLTLGADSLKAADDAARKAIAYMRSMQADLDYRSPNGSIDRINRGAGRYYVEPTKRAYNLLKRAVHFSEMSGGVFDPTVGALTTSPLYYVLDESIAKSKKDLVDYRLVFFDGNKVKLEKEGMAIDLGGIAKGTIIDGTVRLLRNLGIQSGIVEAGGDFYCFGERNWTVGIRHPRDEQVHTMVTVHEKGVCGSGDYQQFVRAGEGDDAEQRHHIIDPSDMEPAIESIGVTVIADSAELADALATTLFIMGPNKGEAFLDDAYPGVAAMWFTPDLKVSATRNFPKK